MPSREFNVYADMVGDLFHGGHVNFLRQARALACERVADRDGVSPEEADSRVRLIVGLLGDEAAAAYKRRPVVPLAERVAVIAACRYVDLVVPECPLSIDEPFIEDHRLDLVVHGDDYGQDEIDRYYSAAVRLGIFATVPYTRTDAAGNPLSTTAILARARAEPGAR